MAVVRAFWKQPSGAEDGVKKSQREGGRSQLQEQVTEERGWQRNSKQKQIEPGRPARPRHIASLRHLPVQPAGERD
jgi:hypothetical protein